MKPCKVTAEIGAVHLGNMGRAKKLIKLAHLAGADCVKLQKRNPTECIPEHLQKAPHPNKIFSYGATYLEHRQKLELSIEQHEELQHYCDNLGISYAVSVFDMTSAREVTDHLDPLFVKVPSCCNNDRTLVEYLLNADNEVHISLGMTNQLEVDSIADFITEKHLSPQKYLLYHCTSEYPCPFERLYLEEIRRLKNKLSPNVRIGFSNHGKGIAVDIAAYILGAEWIERHFVDDRTLRHTDAASSLEPDGLRRLCRDLKAVRRACQSKVELSEEELEQRTKLRK